MVFHAVLLMMLALITLPEQAAATRIVAVANPTDIEEVENLDNENIDPMDVTVFEGEAPADAIASPTDDRRARRPVAGRRQCRPGAVQGDGFRGDVRAER